MSRSSPGRFALLLVALCFAPALARADGAFPDSLGIMLPTDRPDTILVATNFGVLTSADAGTTWHFICERVVGPYAAPYQLGAAPDDLLLAITTDGVSVSRDLGCNWDRVRGAPFSGPSDVFPDPTDPARVFVVGSFVPPDGGAPVSAVFESRDGAALFSAPLFSAPRGAYLTGVEAARSDPSTLVLSMYGAPPGHAALVVSHDAGASWTTTDLSPSIGRATARIAAIDREDPRRVYLRVQDGTPHDRLAIARGDGADVDTPLTLTTPMSAFLRRSDGVLVVGASSEGGAFFSDDGGASFAPWPNAPHLRGLGERDGLLYAVADNFADDFAVAVSSDGGASWEPLMSYRDLVGPASCGDLQDVCAADWQTVKLQFGIGAGDGGDGDAGADTGPTRATGNGCRCTASGDAGSPALLGWVVAGALALRLRRVRRRPLTRR